MYTLAHAHFADFDDVPAAEKLERKPVGALILAIQAVTTFSYKTFVHFSDISLLSYAG
jgi:hypothetical protein